METAIEKLRDLYDEEQPLENRADELRQQQIDLCEKELLGKCFSIKKYEWEKPEGEEYVCFRRIGIEYKYANIFFLEAVVVRIEDIDSCEDFGVTVQEWSDTISEWLVVLDRATEITLDDFKRAQQRAFSYLYNVTNTTTAQESTKK